ncbi:MAG TPA: hypothetical protein VHQ65_12470, partial [Thermoanaerobaculia bacterium]|nr:hypothetical protein [Thermoanaerobaculia bacterium]
MAFLRFPLVLVLTLAVAPLAGAQGLPCAPCVGVEVASPEAAATLAAEVAALAADLDDGTPTVIAWTAELGAATPERHAGAAAAVRAAGLTPWISLRFTAAPPLAEAAGLEAELAAASALVRTAGAGW